MDKRVKRFKRLNRDIYNIFKTKSDMIFNILLIIVGSTPFYEIICSIFDVGNIINFFISLIIVGAVVYKSFGSNKNVLPYKETQQFAGLYSIEDSTPIKIDFNSGLISRETELNCLRNMVCEIFEKDEIGRSICITGESGCGKSTILNLFENKYGKEFQIYNFSSKYDYLDDYIADELKIECSSDTDKNFGEKTVIIFDQFERFLELSVEKRKEAYEIIKSVSIHNVK